MIIAGFSVRYSGFFIIVRIRAIEYKEIIKSAHARQIPLTGLRSRRFSRKKGKVFMGHSTDFKGTRLDVLYISCRFLTNYVIHKKPALGPVSILL